MASTRRMPIKRIGIIAGAAALLMSLTPGQAFASSNINIPSNVPCGPSDYLQIWFHDDSGSHDQCWANAGVFYPWTGKTIWLDKISTGNNDVVIHDDNGTDVYISRWNIVTYPNRPIATTHLTIL